MDISGSPLAKFFGGLFGQLVKFLDTAYKEQWLIYLIVGIIIIGILLLFF